MSRRRMCGASISCNLEIWSCRNQVAVISPPSRKSECCSGSQSGCHRVAKQRSLGVSGPVHLLVQAVNTELERLEVVKLGLPKLTKLTSLSRRSKESWNDSRSSNLEGIRKCSSVQSSSRLFCNGVPVSGSSNSRRMASSTSAATKQTAQKVMHDLQRACAVRTCCAWALEGDVLCCGGQCRFRNASSRFDLQACLSAGAGTTCRIPVEPGRAWTISTSAGAPRRR